MFKKEITGRVLLVDDDEALAELAVDKLTSEGHTVEWVKSGEDALAGTLPEESDVAILDYKLPGMDGLEVLKNLLERNPGLPVIFITSYGDHELAIKSLELGAKEYINKPFNFSNLAFYVFKLLKDKKSVSLKMRKTKSSVENKSTFIRNSPAMKKLVDRIPAYASAELPILISGETGTGKERMAVFLATSDVNPRKGKSFFAVNCMAIPDSLVESELFGHVKGAFTGALLEKKGFFEVSDEGILFLDEISGASLSVQGKLLRIIESGEFYRVGDTTPRKSNVLLYVATNKDLFDEVSQGRFRQDLYYRLNGLRIDLPPLRDRKSDIAPLVERFLIEANEKYSKNVSLSEDVTDCFLDHDWPGNIRELKNVVVTAVSIAGKDDVIEVDDLPQEIRDSDNGAGPDETFDSKRKCAIADFERNYLSSILTKTRGNVTEAARLSGLSRQSIFAKLKKHGMTSDEFRN